MEATVKYEEVGLGASCDRGGGGERVIGLGRLRRGMGEGGGVALEG